MRRRGGWLWIGVPLVLGATAILVAAQTAQDNPHGQLRFACDVCHSTETWSVPPRPQGFDHAKTGFTLVGQHGAVKCRDCHRELTFAHVGTACADCHTDVHRGQLGPLCERCHSPSGWQNRGPLFQQHAERGFPLVGVHAVVDCDACHTGAQRQEFAGTPLDCFGCHAVDYNRTTNPPHAASGMPTTCEMCHQPIAGWGSGGFDHGSFTGFALTGMHATIACTTCHAGGRWTGLPTNCYGCHAADYNGTTDPPHAASNIPTNCEECHSTSSWGGGSFNHAAATGFALTGAHATITCTTCHANGQWAGLPLDCNGCHAADYAATNNPSHAAAAFPTTCATCHTTSAWQPSTWNHDPFFPITSGAHAGVWTSCATCHTNPADYTVFDCIDCHTHDQATTDGQHGSVTGYQYLSTACYQCHPTGRAGG